MKDSATQPGRSLNISIFTIIVLVGVFVLVVNAHHVRLPDLLGDGDISANGLLIRDACDLQLGVGPYSRLGYNHPGPVTFYYLAAAEPLVGGVPSPLGRQRSAMLVLNLAGLAVALMLVGRVTGRSTDVWLLASALVFTILPVATTRHHPLLDFWGPLIVIIPTLVFVLAAGPAARGKIGLVPVLCLSGVFAVHNHLISAVLVAVVGIIVLARLVWLRLRNRLPQPTGREKVWLVLGIAFVVVTSVPILVEQFGGDDGNISRILDTTWDQPGQSRNLADDVRATGWAAVASVTLGVPGLDSHIGLVPMGMLITLPVVWGIAGWRQYRRANRDFRAMIISVALAYGITFIIATQTNDNPVHVPYIFHFTSGFAAFFFFLLLRELCCWTDRPGFRATRVPGLLTHGAVAVFLSAVVMVVWVSRFQVEPMPGHPVPREIWSELPSPQAGPIGAFLKFPCQDHSLWPNLVSFVLQAEQRGYDVYVNSRPAIFRSRIGPGDRHAPTVLVSREGLRADGVASGLQQRHGVFAVLSPGGTFAELDRQLAVRDLEPLILGRWALPEGGSLGFRRWYGRELAGDTVFRWNKGDESSIFFELEENFPSAGGLVLEMNLGAHGHQSVSVTLNGRHVADLDLHGFGEVRERIDIPAEVLQSVGGYELRFLVPEATRSKGTDSRVLGLRFVGLRFSSVGH